MGDAVLTVPAVVDSIIRSYPDAEIDALLRDESAKLLDGQPGIAHIYSYNAPWVARPTGLGKIAGVLFWLRKAREMRVIGDRQLRCPYDFVIHLSLSAWERFFAKGWGREQSGFMGPYKGFRYAFSQRILTKSVEFDTTSHSVDNCLRLVDQAIGLPFKASQSRLFVSEEMLTAGKNDLMRVLGNKRPYIVMQPGGAGSMKSWGVCNFCRIANRAEREFGAGCVFVGPSELLESARIEADAENISFPLVIPTDEISHFKAVAAAADIFLANDGGPMHIAAALGVPTLAVFGPTDERVFGPRGSNARVVREKDICGRQHYPWKPATCCVVKDRECLRGIRSETVWQALIEVMNGLSYV